MQMRWGSPQTLVIPSPCDKDRNGKDISCKKVKNELKVAAKEMGQDKMRNLKWKWKGKLLKAHPRRPRGSQSGREKRRDESFQVRAKEPLGTDS